MSQAGIRRRARIAGTGLVAVAGLVLLLNGIWIGRHLDELGPISAGAVAPAIALPAIDARGAVSTDVLRLDELRGQVVVMDFWATWCGPCRQSLPAIERVHRRHAGRGLAMVSINTDDPAEARAMFERMSVTLPLYLDNGTAADLYKVSTIPHLVVIDRRGIVRYVHRGFSGERALDAQVRELLDQD